MNTLESYAWKWGEVVFVCFSRNLLGSIPNAMAAVKAMANNPVSSTLLFLTISNCYCKLTCTKVENINC